MQYSIHEDISLSRNRALLLRINSMNTESLSSSKGQLDKEEVLKRAKKIDISHMVDNLEEQLISQNKITDQGVTNLNTKMRRDLNNELIFEGTYKQASLIKDLQCRFKVETQFLDCMEYKQQNAVTHNILNSQEKRKDKFIFPQKERPKKDEDYVCQICNDGDYTDSNKIVFCARCNISYHQRCYSIDEVPHGSWVCDLCTYYGPEGRLVRCALCTRRGGCLRRTNIKSRDEFWKSRNPSYYDAACKKAEIGTEPSFI